MSERISEAAACSMLMHMEPALVDALRVEMPLASMRETWEFLGLTMPLLVIDEHGGAHERTGLIVREVPDGYDRDVTDVWYDNLARGGR